MKRDYPFSIASDFGSNRYTSRTPLPQHLRAIPTSRIRTQITLSSQCQQPLTERPFTSRWMPHSLLQINTGALVSGVP